MGMNRIRLIRRAPLQEKFVIYPIDCGRKVMIYYTTFFGLLAQLVRALP